MATFLTIGKKIIGIGRNYKAHAAELNNKVPEIPLFFLKPTSSYVTQGNPIIKPSTCKVLHYEVELAVVISKKCHKVPKEDAMKYVAGYTVALDMTARDLQDNAIKNGHPWSQGKGYDTFCAVGDFVETKNINPHDVELWLKVNGTLKQKGNTSQMIFNVPYLISYISGIMTLDEGDVILTGTPQGVGPVEVGDTITNNL